MILMLRYSYKVELKRLLTNKIALEMALLDNPLDEKLKNKLQENIKQILWFENKIKEGKDPGIIVL